MKSSSPSLLISSTTQLRVCLLFAILLVIPAELRSQQDLSQHVDPFIGTGGHGHTYPGATMPFGMVQLSPDTRLTGWDGCSGYHYSDKSIYGFSHTHLSGTGISDYGDILFAPTVSEIFITPRTGEAINSFAWLFSHDNEKAEPGYYAVKLDNGIFAELTATLRVGFHHYTFPASAASRNLLIDLAHRDRVVDSYLRIVDATHVEAISIFSRQH